MHHGRLEARDEDRATAGWVARVRRARAFLTERARPLAVALAGGAAVLLSGGVGPTGWSAFGRPPVAPDDRADMAAAERTIDSLRAAAYAAERPGAAQGRLTDAALLALSYHERLRLGLGSPFRLADYALRDPRLDARLRRATALSILARTSRGESHAIDPLTLATNAERLSDASADPIVPASRQRDIIDSVVLAAPSARTGEETVRLALRLAESEHLVDRGAVVAGIQAAALARDRRLAAIDARRLLAAAARLPDDVLTLLQQWRVERRLAVEQPLLSDALHPSWPDATRDAVRLVAELRASARPLLADSGAPPTTLAAESRAFVQRAYLPRWAALRVADLPSVRSAPPQAPVTVTTAGARRRLAAAVRPALSWLDPYGEARAAARWRFVDRARTEESLAAEQAVARAALLVPGDGRAPSGEESEVADLALAAAVAMRAYGQEPVWFPSFGGPDDEELRARFGLRRVVFDPVVPSPWRPYYRHLLASALAELRGVLPSLSFDGLTVRIGESVKRDSALALHDPATRTVFLPAATGAGTIAHEIAHDLDWQTARSRLALRGAYSTDRAARDGTAPPSLARSVRGLTAARPRSGGPQRGESRERPAELFARGIDWLAAAALAREGRMNGYLTSVQDADIPGYAGVVVPEPGERGADALIDVLDDMTTLPWVTRAWYLDRFGASAAEEPDAIIRLALSATTGAAAERSLRVLGLPTPLLVADPARAGSWRGGGDLPACRLVAREPWRAQLLWAAAESRARGVLRTRARRWGMAPFPSPAAWELQAVLGAPWNPALATEAIRRTRDAVLRQVARDDDARGPAARTGLAAVVYGRCR